MSLPSSRAADIPNTENILASSILTANNTRGVFEYYSEPFSDHNRVNFFKFCIKIGIVQVVMGKQRSGKNSPFKSSNQNKNATEKQNGPPTKEQKNPGTKTLFTINTNKKHNINCTNSSRSSHS